MAAMSIGSWSKDHCWWTTSLYSTVHLAVLSYVRHLSLRHRHLLLTTVEN
jgi:hypothetical protein